MVRLGYCTHKKAGGYEDKIAEELEQWVPKDQFRRLNEATAGPRQMWADSNNHDWMREIACSMGCLELLASVVAGVKVGDRANKSPKLHVQHEVLEAAEERFHASKEGRA